MGRGVRAVVTAVVTLLAVVAVGVALLPASGVDTDPPICTAWRGYEVSCTTWPSWIVMAGFGALTAAVVWRLTRPSAMKGQTRELVG